MIGGNGARTARVRVRALGTSAMTLAAVLAGPAFAQCAPEPTVVNGATICRGTDTDGLRVTTFGTRVTVEQSATVRGAGEPAIAIRIASGDGLGTPVDLSVAGLVDGGADAGVSLITQDIPNSFFSQSLALTVLPGGRVTGANGIVVGRESNQTFISTNVTVDNNGSIVGTDGAALLSTDATAGFSSITNRASGFIGAIVGPVGTINNAGTINGGSRSAIDFGSNTRFFGDIINSGTIGSTGSTATLAGVPGFRAVINTGTIENGGPGAAIAGARSVNVNNAATGRIASGGTTAISAGDTLQLTNAGTIIGDVVAGGTSTFSGSTVDSTAGRLTGSLRLGAGADTLIGTFDGTRLQYGITGTIDGGAGIDTIRARFATNATLTAPLALPTAFERLALSPNATVTATLAPGFVAPGTLLIGGAGTLVNRAALSGDGQILTTDFQNGGTPAIVNTGSIASTLNSTGTFAVSLTSFNRFENSGTITATRDAVSLSGSGLIVNSGTITAGGTALSTFTSAFTNTATGVIRSTGGTGLVLSGSSFGVEQSNAGRIEGTTVGVQLSSILTNTGTIASGQNGVILDGSGVLDNRTGGSVTGGSVAITTQPPGSNFFSFSNTVANAGTITGNVVLGGQRAGFNNNRFFALPGGVLNGNLTLGQGDLLVTELVNTSQGAFAGITGSVTANAAQLRLRVRQDVTATIAPPAGFTSVGYELFDGAALTLTGVAGTRPLLLAGNGRVDVTADITTTNASAIQSTSVLIGPGETSTASALTITSRGALSLVRPDANSFPGAVVALGGNDSFTNTGTIIATDRAATIFSPFAAISGGFFSSSTSGTSVTNAGTITLDGTIGITGARTITNSGNILQDRGGRAATGIRIGSDGFAGTLTNTGTIDVAGVAVQADFASLSITNSGRIASSGTTAISAVSGFNLVIDNLAGGMIAGAAGGAAIQSGGGRLINAGTITGTVDLGFSSFGRSFTSATYTADGGTIAGDLLFGSAGDTLIAFTPLGITGTVDGGNGIDTLIQARRASDTVTLGLAGIVNFERQGVRALGTDTMVTVRADAAVTGDLLISGTGTIANTATLSGAVRTQNFGEFADGTFQPAPLLAGFTNIGTVEQGVFGPMIRFANSGTIGSDVLAGQAINLRSPESLSFANDGRIANNRLARAVTLSSEGADIAASNTGTVAGGLSAVVARFSVPEDVVSTPATVALFNSGTIGATGTGRSAVQLITDLQLGNGTVTLTNAGTIETSGERGIGAFLGSYGSDETAGQRLAVANTGTIRANGGGSEVTGTTEDSEFRYTVPATALLLAGAADGPSATLASVTNALGATIEATGSRSTAIVADGVVLDLTNAGTVQGGPGTALAANDRRATDIGRSFLAGAIQSYGLADDRIVNTGTVIGSIDLGAGTDRIDNFGRIDGNVFLGTGNDIFLQRASATLVGTVDAGEGDDLFVVDATGGGTINGDQFINFERFNQVGEGEIAYSGTFRFNTVGVMGGTVTVAVGQTLASDGAVTITGTDAAETVVNDGTIAGGVSLAGGNDRVVNRGTIGGAVLLGDGNDAFVEGPGSRVAGGVDGGTGVDTYTVLLAGDRQGIGARIGFERLAVEGTGTLDLTLDQHFETVSLLGTGLIATLNGFTIGAVTGSGNAERLVVDGDVASVSLGAGDDLLSLGTTQAAGHYEGGAGSDVLSFTAAGPVTLAGTATGFERLSLAGGALVVTGTLGTAEAAIGFGDGAQMLTVAPGGTLTGTIDLGAGNDAFRLAAGGILAGTVAGGMGIDTATVELAGDRTLAAATLSGFETLASEGRGILTLTGAQTYDLVTAATDLTVAGGGSLTARQVRFGAGDQRFTIAGGFAGAVDGGAGVDTIAVSGGSAAALVAFTDVTAIEALAMTGGYATVSGSAGFGFVDMSGGRLVGLSGSTIAANQILVRQGAIFGSAGTVTGNLTVAGILSPGASPGTMTVNGNVALQSGSLSVFELTPTAQDRLVVNGAVSIASGATLQLVPTGTLRPGTSYDLVTATGGITGSFSTVVKPDSLFGFVAQRADRIQLVGQFLADPGFSPQVARSVAYANGVLAQQAPTSPLFSVLPSLVDANGTSNARAFAQLTPEAYASATQLGVENALALTDVARGPAFATDRTEPGAFTFAQGVGSWYRLAGEPVEGVNTARTSSYGFLGGIGYGDRGWMAGAFGGYLDSRQRIDALGASTGADGWVAGIHGRYRADRLGFGASVVYNAAQVDTQRALPGGTGANGRFDLDSWIADLSVNYALDIGEWALTPRAGITYARTTRERLVETGGPFALTVARDRHVAGFADGGLGFGRGEASEAAFRPFVALGVRYQIEGQRADAVASYAGGPLGLIAIGASRSRMVGTASAGLSYRMNNGLDLFSTVSAQTGRDDHREAISTGVRLRF